MVKLLGWLVLVLAVVFLLGFFWAALRAALWLFRDGLERWYAKNFGPPVIEEPAPVPCVANLPQAQPVEETPELAGRLFLFRGRMYQEQGEEDGVVTFTRDVVVNGRSVQEEVQVLAADLTQGEDGLWTLNGRN
jgi:hypothetical protein